MPNGKTGNTMKILISGNLGYIGPVLVSYLREKYPKHELVGYDFGLFSHTTTVHGLISDVKLDSQIYGDVRNIKQDIFEDVDAIVYLAAISNDPMGNKFEKPTMEINFESAVNWALLAKTSGVKNFVFASSCSVYGLADDKDRTELSEVNPLTAYAKSKVNAEVELAKLANDSFNITCLRFATACGWSDRLRLDLVLNDFVAGALVNKKIEILSDGTPWRPLIHVEDMSRAIDWGIHRKQINDDSYIVVNVGSNDWNLQIKELAYQVEKIVPNTSVFIDPNGQPDMRSYRVDFSKFKSLAPDFQPIYTTKNTIEGILKGLKEISFNDSNYRNSQLIRLNVIQQLISKNQIDLDIKSLI